MCLKREEMPQIEWKDYGDFLLHCVQQGVTVRKGAIAPQMLRSVQCPGYWKRHRVDMASLKKPILNSGDHVVLDGNTRWHTALVKGIEELPHYELHLTYPEALKFMFGYSRAYNIAMNKGKEWTL